MVRQNRPKKKKKEKLFQNFINNSERKWQYRKAVLLLEEQFLLQIPIY